MSHVELSNGLEAAAAVVHSLAAAGYCAYLVGGCVRDLLMGHAPKDYDVATDARPDAVMELFPRSFGVGAHFGVVLVPMLVDGQEIVTEVATFRSDGVYSDGRRPDEVAYTDDPQQDVLRRDFTINGMLLDVDQYLAGGDAAAAVLDYVGGREDLRAGVVRAIGKPMRRFSEDKLRMVRAVRFAARFEFTIERETFAAIRVLAGEIGQVSRERMRDELNRMLTEGHAAAAFEMLEISGLLLQVLPEVAAMRGVAQPPEYHPEGDVWVHTLMLLEKLPAGCSVTLAWGALLHDVGKPPTYMVSGSHPLQRSCGGGDAHGGGDLPAAALLQRGDGADPVTGGEPHALRRRGEDEGVDAEAVLPAAEVSRASGTASAGCDVEPQPAGALRFCEGSL